MTQRTALFVSPHLDDVAFSCGGTLIALVDRGWDVHLCTIFTGSVLNPTGFALACQTDKGLAPDVDYMELRRAEDRQFAAIARIDQITHLPHLEAPHRGYESARDLFNGVHPDDTIWHAITGDVQRMVMEIKPELVFAPQGLGNHVDHLHVIQAVIDADLIGRTCWYRDTPYAIRKPDAQPSDRLPAGLHTRAVDISGTLGRKLDGSCAYTTQIGFQFGGAARLRDVLTAFHHAEAQRVGVAGPVETLLVPHEIEVDQWFAA